MSKMSKPSEDSAENGVKREKLLSHEAVTKMSRLSVDFMNVQSSMKNCLVRNPCLKCQGPVMIQLKVLQIM